MGIMIEGVKLYPLKHIVVPKGDIYHVLKLTDEGYAGFGEAYFSQIEAGVVKGWKRHNRMTLNIVVPVGAIRFVIYDDRKGSASFGEFQEITLSPANNYQRLMLSPGLWMAFQGVGEGTSMLLDIIPEAHNSDESSRKDLSEISYTF